MRNLEGWLKPAVIIAALALGGCTSLAGPQQDQSQVVHVKVDQGPPLRIAPLTVHHDVRIGLAPQPKAPHKARKEAVPVPAPAPQPKAVEPVVVQPVAPVSPVKKKSYLRRLFGL